MEMKRNPELAKAWIRYLGWLNKRFKVAEQIIEAGCAIANRSLHDLETRRPKKVLTEAERTNEQVSEPPQASERASARHYHRQRRDFIGGASGGPV